MLNLIEPFGPAEILCKKSGNKFKKIFQVLAGQTFGQKRHKNMSACSIAVTNANSYKLSLM